MDELDYLMAQYPQITFVFDRTPHGLKGLTVGDKIIISSEISKEEQTQWLYEELGHIFTTVGDISDYSAGRNAHDELKARKWGMKHYLPLEKLKKTADKQYDTDDEAADDLGVQTDYLHEVGLMYGFKYKSVK